MIQLDKGASGPDVVTVHPAAGRLRAVAAPVGSPGSGRPASWSWHSGHSIPFQPAGPFLDQAGTAAGR